MPAATICPCSAISAVTGEMCSAGAATPHTGDARRAAHLPDEAPEELVELSPAPDPKAFQIDEVEENVWLVQGVEIEKVVKMTNWDYYEAGLRFQRILSALGITDALREAGVEDGDTVRIGDVELVWGYENALGE